MVAPNTFFILITACALVPKMFGMNPGTLLVTAVDPITAPATPAAPTNTSTPDSGTLESDNEIYYDASETLPEAPATTPTTPPPKPPRRVILKAKRRLPYANEPVQTELGGTRVPSKRPASDSVKFDSKRRRVVTHPEIEIPDVEPESTYEVPPLPPKTRKNSDIAPPVKPDTSTNTYKSFGYFSETAPPVLPTPSQETVGRLPTPTPEYESYSDFEFGDEDVENTTDPQSGSLVDNRFRKFKDYTRTKAYNVKQSVKGAVHKTSKESSKLASFVKSKTTELASDAGSKITETKSKLNDVSDTADHEAQRMKTKFTNSARQGLSTVSKRVRGAAHKTAKEATKLGNNLRQSAKSTRGSMTKFFRSQFGDLVTEDEIDAI